MTGFEGAPMAIETALPADWAEVLARIQQWLDQTLASVEVPPEPAEVPSPWHALAEETTERLRQRLARLDERAARARQDGQQLEALLTFEAEALDAWCAAAAEVRAQLARATGRAIS